MQLQKTLKIYLTTSVATLLLFFVYKFLNFYLDGSIWDGMKISKSALRVEYCELYQADKFFRQTMNSYSNLSYFFLGCIVVQLALFDFRNKDDNQKNILQRFPMLSMLFGLCMIYLCFGSTFFHASMTWVGQRADMNGAYGIAILLIAIGIYRRFPQLFDTTITRKLFVLTIITLIIFFLQVHVWVPIYILIPALLIVLITITAINYSKLKSHTNRDLLYLSILFTVAAALFRTLDVMKIACNPTSIYQGHVLWHFFIGMAAFFLYWFYRSEQISQH